MKYLLLVLCLSFACAMQQKYFPAVQDAIEDEYIVVLKEGVSVADYLENSNGLLELMHTYTIINGFAAKMTTEQVKHHVAHDLVEFVEENQVYRATACKTQTSATWGITRISKASSSDRLDGQYTYDSSTAGKGVTAYIIDTGVLVSHTDFEGRATFGFQAPGTGSNTDKNGHGTHVASTVGGKTYGVAKEVEIVAVKVLGDNGSGSTAGVIAGVDYAAVNCNGRKCVLNMSLGGGYSAALNSAVNSAVGMGVASAVAAGNDNRDAGSYSPASASDVVTVGATAEADYSGKQLDVRSFFSNYGSSVDIFAPGSAITAAWIGSNNAINTISGTSMASPHVCGALAVLMSAGASASQAQQAVVSNAAVGQIDLSCSSSSCNNSPNKMLYSPCPAV